MNKKIFIAILLVAASQSFSHASERSEIIKQIEGEKISLETGRPRDPNIKRSEFNKQRIAKIRELNGKLKKLEAKKQK
jgi:Skp family chaperone for outer membrane proteins